MMSHPNIRPTRHTGLLGFAAVALCVPGAGHAAELRAVPTPATGASAVTLETIKPNDASCGRAPLTGGSEVGEARCDAMLGLNFRAIQATEFGTFEAFTTVAGSSSDALTPEQMLLRRDQRSGGDNRVILAGLKAGLFSDRIKLTAQMGWSENLGGPLRVAISPDRRSQPRDGTSTLLKLELKLIDQPRLNWTMAGEMSDVSDDFTMGQAMAMRGQIAFPGRRITLSTALKMGPARLTAALDNSRTSFGSFSTRRLGVSLNGVSLGVRTSSNAISPLAGTGLIAAQSDYRNLSLDIDLASLSPSLAAQTGLLATLVPRNLMVNWRSGTGGSITTAASDHYARSSWELNASWETPIGETTVGYWQDRKVGAEPGYGLRRDQTLQLSHMVRRDRWRFGIDGMWSSTASDKGRGQTDRSFSLGGSIAYSSPGGPQLMIAVGRDHSRGQSGDNAFQTSQDYSSITASLDLTDYLRKQFDRQDLWLRLDYRKRLEASTYNFADVDQNFDAWSDRDQREGLLLSFGMKL